LQAGLSAKGFTLSRNIMKLNRTAGQLVGQLDQFDETLYYVTVMGTPSADEPWGWQFEGHHLVVNYFVLGDQVVMTPTFMGSEPVTATVGEYKGLRVFDEEIAVGLAVMEALDQSQRSKAVVEATKSGNNAQTEAFKDNAVVPYAGVRAADLSSGQRERLMGLAGQFVGNMDDAHAAVKLAEVREHLDDTWFSWVGGTGASDAFYYRLQSPVVLIEFDCQGPGPIGQGTGGGNQPSRDHIHSVVRTPNGNDYGKDLLRQHLAAHPH
jgi:hypothetical protein